MVNLSPLVLAIAILATAVNACDTACSVSSDTAGTCIYSCFDRCNFTADDHQRNFLGGLKGAGYDCIGYGASSGISCKKTAEFGKCASHYWQCENC
jgi:hypothetical protein